MPKSAAPTYRKQKYGNKFNESSARRGAREMSMCGRKLMRQKIRHLLESLFFDPLQIIAIAYRGIRRWEAREQKKLARICGLTKRQAKWGGRMASAKQILYRSKNETMRKTAVVTNLAAVNSSLIANSQICKSKWNQRYCVQCIQSDKRNI